MADGPQNLHRTLLGFPEATAKVMDDPDAPFTFSLVDQLRDPRVTLLMHSLSADGTGNTYATVYGPVELYDDPDGSFHRVMYDIHMGGATPPPEPGVERLVVCIRPQRTYALPPYSPPPAG